MQKVTYSILLALLCASLSAQSIQKGIEQYESKQFKKAQASFKSIDSNNPEYAKAQYYLGRIAFDQDEYSDAIDFFEEATEYEETNANYFAWLGNAYGMRVDEVSKLRQGMIAPKIKSNYEKAASLDPSNLEAQWGLVEYYTQAPSFMGGSFEKAIETAKTIKEYDLKEGFRASYTIYQRQGNSELALESLEQLAEMDDNFRFSLGLFYHTMEKYDEAYALFNTLRSEEPNNTSVLYQVGRTSALSGKHLEEGIDALNEYLDLPLADGTPSYAAAKMRLGMIYEKSGDTEKAIKYYSNSVKEDPEMELAQEGLKRLKN